MSLVIGMAILGAIGMFVIWAPAYPKPVRHEHLRAMDALAEPVRLHGCGRFHRPGEDCPDEFPHGRCWCGGAYDRRGVCEDVCARESWDR